MLSVRLIFLREISHLLKLCNLVESSSANARFHITLISQQWHNDMKFDLSQQDCALTKLEMMCQNSFYHKYHHFSTLKELEKCLVSCNCKIQNKNMYWVWVMPKRHLIMQSGRKGN